MQEKRALKDTIREEKKIYLKLNHAIEAFTHKKRYLIWKYLAAFRMMQYYKFKMGTGSVVKKAAFRFMYYLRLRKANKLSVRCGVEIANSCSLGKGINIYHGGVVISAAKIGDNCTIRGNTVIGNKGLKKYNGEPVIGNNVEIGAGANIIGNVTIADGCEIGANSVVTKSFLEPNSIIVGVPARIMERK